MHFGIPLAAFALGTVVAELAGAANLGTAMTVGQVAFAIAVVAVLLRRGGGPRPGPRASSR